MHMHAVQVSGKRAEIHITRGRSAGFKYACRLGEFTRLISFPGYGL